MNVPAVYASVLLFLPLLLAPFVEVVEAAWITHPELEEKSEEILTACELKRLYAKDFQNLRGLPDGIKFEQALRALAGPVVVEGAVDNWIALSKWKNQTYFLKKFGSVKIDASSLHKGNPNELVDKTGPDTLLRDFVRDWKDKDEVLFQMRGMTDKRSLVLRLKGDLRNSTGAYGVAATPPLFLGLNFPNKVMSMGPPREVLTFMTRVCAP